MNKIYATTMIVLTALLLNACGLGSVRGSGNVVAENRAVSGFDKVTLSGIGEVVLTQGATESLKIEAEDNLMPYVETVVRNGTLEIGFRNSEITSFQPTRPIIFHLTMKDVRGLVLSGSGKIDAASIKTDQLALRISGSGDINASSVSTDGLTTIIDGSGNVTINTIAAKTLASTITGSGKCTLSGKVTDQSLVVNGSGKYEASSLESQTMAVTVRGSGNSVVNASQALDVKIYGSGDVRYYGSPKINSSITGSGKVQRLGD